MEIAGVGEREDGDYGVGTGYTQVGGGPCVEAILSLHKGEGIQGGGGGVERSMMASIGIIDAAQGNLEGYILGGQ